jgi:hypothetical protein
VYYHLMMQVGTVFVSHTAEMMTFPTDRSYVRAVMDAALRAGFHPVEMGTFTANPLPPADFCRARVLDCDVFVGVIGFRYGSLVPELQETSYIDLEFREATREGTPRLIFLLDDVAPITRSMVDVDGRRIEEFRHRLLTAGTVVRTFRTPGELGEAVMQALQELREQASRPGQPRRRHLLSLHALPTNSARSVPRPVLLAEAKTHLLRAPEDRLRIVGLTGMGGTGKTTLARALISDQDVRDRYPDGIVWVELGQHADLVSCQSLVTETYGDRRPVVDVAAGRDRLNQLLLGARTLVVLDNVCSTDQIHAFNMNVPESTLLITTRAAEILFHDALVCEVGTVEDGEARRILANYSGYVEDELPAEALSVVSRCGGLALALSIAGGMVREGRRWRTVDERLRRSDLDNLNAPLSDYPFSLLTALDASVAALLDEHRIRFLELVVFDGCGPVPVAVLSLLWSLSGVNELDSEDLVLLFSRRGLIRYEPEEDTVTVHDLLLDYMSTAIAPDRVNHLHRRLAHLFLDSWGAVDAGLPRMPVEGSLNPTELYKLTYAFDHLARGGEVALVHRILALEMPGELQRNLCHTAYERCGQVSTYLRAIRLAWRLAERTTDEERALGQASESIALEVLYALVVGSIVTTAASVPVALLVSLVEQGLWTSQQALTFAQSIPSPRERTRALIGISAADDEETRTTALRAALGLARSAVSPFARTRTVLELASQGQLNAAVEQILRLASTVSHQYTRFCVLLDAAEQLDGSHYATLLEAASVVARAIPNPRSREEALTRLADLSPARGGLPPTPLPGPALVSAQMAPSPAAAIDPPQVYEQILDLARAISSEESEEDDLPPVSAVPYELAEPQRTTAVMQALDLARGVSHPVWRAKALTDLGSQLSGAERNDALTGALDVTNTITEPARRARSLAYLAPHLPLPERRRVVDLAVAIVKRAEDPSAQVKAYIDVLPLVDGEEREEALRGAFTAARCHLEPYRRARALALILPLASPRDQAGVADEILALVHGISSAYSRARVYAGVLAHVSVKAHAAALAEALAAARAVKNPYRRSRALIALVPHLDGDPRRRTVLDEALEASLQVSGPYWQSRSLTRIAPHLAAAERHHILSLSLDAVHNVTDPDRCAEALSAMAGLLSPDLLHKALDVARTPGGRYWRIMVTAILLKHLPEEHAAPVDAHTLLQETQHIRGPYWQARAVATLAPRLTENERVSALADCLHAASVITDDDRHGQALVELFHVLPRELEAEAIEAVRGIVSDAGRRRALVALSPRVRRNRYPQLLDLARETESLGTRAVIFADLARVMSGSERSTAVEEAYSTAALISDLNERAETFAEICDVLPSGARSSALSTITEIQDPFQRVQVTARAAAHLPLRSRQHVCREALSAVDSISDPLRRMQALASLFPGLSLAEQEKAFTSLMSVAELAPAAHDRVRVLAPLLAHLPSSARDELLGHCFDLAMTVVEPYEQVSCLLSLAPYAGPRDLEEILRWIPNVSSTYGQALLLAGIAAFLPLELKDEALALAAGLENSTGRVWAIEALVLADRNGSSRWGPQWRAALESAALASHRSVLCLIALADTSIAECGGPQGVDACIDAIQAVEKWWA